MVTAAVLLTVVLSGLAAWKHVQPPVLPKHVLQTAGFRLYYPAQLPDGFALDASSVQAEQQVVIFNFLRQKQRLSVTQQPQSIGFDFNDVPGAEKKTVAALGTVYYISNRQFNGAGIVTADSTIFISNPNQLNTAAFAALVESFKPVH